jgi:hypothetical protein
MSNRAEKAEIERACKLTCRLLGPSWTRSQYQGHPEGVPHCEKQTIVSTGAHFVIRTLKLFSRAETDPDMIVLVKLCYSK